MAWYDQLVSLLGGSNQKQAAPQKPMVSRASFTPRFDSRTSTAGIPPAVDPLNMPVPKSNKPMVFPMTLPPLVSKKRAEMLAKAAEPEVQPLAQKQVGDFASGLAGQVVGAIPKVAIKFAKSAEPLITGEPERPYIPQSDLATFLFGKDPISSVAEDVKRPNKQILEARSAGDFAKGIGGLGLVMGGTLLDVVPGASGEKKVVGEVGEQVLKHGDEAIPAVKSFLTKFLPKDLAGAKPAYSFGAKQFSPIFESDLDKAAYILAQKKPSKREADFLESVIKNTGLEETEIRAHGVKVKDFIKSIARDAEPGQIKVPSLFEPKGSTLDTASKAPPALAEVVSPTTGDKIVEAGKQRELITSVKSSPQFETPVKEGVEGTYSQLSNKELQERAAKMIEQDSEAVLAKIRSTDSATAEEFEATRQLVLKAQQQGRYQDAIDLVDQAAKKATSQGQAIQALSLWGRLTPEGALKYTQRIIEEANSKSPLRKIGAMKKIELKPDSAKEITELATDLQKLPEGSPEKTRGIARLMDKIAQQVPREIGDKLATFQTIAQLLNPKTIARNTIGNAGFAALENVSQTLGSALDKGISLITGKRTVVPPSLKKQGEGLVRGFKLGLEDALSGTDTSGGITGMLDYGNKRTFRTGVLGKLETGLNVALRGVDRAFYQAAYDETVDNMIRARGASALDKLPAKVRQEIEEAAHYMGLYRTFQDDTFASKFMVGAKKLLNEIGLKRSGLGDFGAGDLILKYPKTPANILMRGIDYTPAGFFRSVMELAKPVIGGNLSSFNQRKFVQSSARALTGSSIIGTGAALFSLGVITGKKNDKKDVAQLDREVGLGEYKMNVSALKRLVLSGFSPDAAKTKVGDKVINYDWFQPNAIGLAMGADIAANEGSKKSQVIGFLSSLLEGTGAAVDTLVDQPLFTGIQRITRAPDWRGALRNTLSSMPASFVPTFVNQMRQLMDNNQRDAYDPSFLTETLNQVRNRIPGLQKDLPVRRGLFGEERQTYQNDSNTLFNVFLNPAFSSKIEESPEVKLVMDVYRSTGETQQIPNPIARKQEAFGQSFELTGSEIQDIQGRVGSAAKNIFGTLADNQDFQAMSDVDKATKLSGILTKLGQRAKIEPYLTYMNLKTPEGMDPEVQFKVIERVNKAKDFNLLDREKQREVIQNVMDQVGKSEVAL